MATVKEMIEWLNTLPQDAEVLCGEEDFCGYDIRMVHSPVDIEACAVQDAAGRVIVKINA